MQKPLFKILTFKGESPRTFSWKTVQNGVRKWSIRNEEHFLYGPVLKINPFSTTGMPRGTASYFVIHILRMLLFIYILEFLWNFLPPQHPHPPWKSQFWTIFVFVMTMSPFIVLCTPKSSVFFVLKSWHVSIDMKIIRARTSIKGTYDLRYIRSTLTLTNKTDVIIY